MNLLDWLLVLFALGYALSGFRQGFVIGALATLGLLTGGLVGVLVAPRLFDEFAPSLTLSVAALCTVLVCAVIGQAVAAYFGAGLRRRITWHPARAVDAIGGAALSGAAALVVAWALGVAVLGAQIPSVNALVQSSTVLRTVDAALPGDADQMLGALTDVVDQSIFPRYLEPFVTERIVEVDPPTRRILRDPQIAAASESVVKILGTAESCARSVEGSGFVYAPDRVMTNAHVVAGVDEPQVVVDEQALPAQVVVYDSDLDIAVLAVEGLSGAPLTFAEDADTGDTAAVLGYPENGPFDAEPARIRSEQRLRSPDIYGRGTVVRDVLSVYADVRPGNSGGPLVSPGGEVYGVIFAASISDERTGYAVTAEQVADDAESGRVATEPVDTGACSS
ncbi:MAG: MarP family serine protease [Actinomycetota bacterium]|nr:MarP family serine protease [Actinomycetota bacterium]